MDTNELKTMTAGYLIGQAMARLDKIQQHLIQGEDSEALSSTNEAVRFLNQEINKFQHMEISFNDPGKL